jgi:RNA polymerase sigma-70 factor (ECF subfamily)
VAELYEAHAGGVFAYAYHLAGSREDAEDLVQTAFLQAHRSMLRGEELLNPRAWLTTVVKRQMFNRWRDRREFPADQLADTQLAQNTDGEASDDLARVRAILLALPEAQHHAFVLQHWSGLTVREIATVIETTPAAVESLLVRARTAVLNAGPVADACIGVRDTLARTAQLTPPDHRHIDGCKGCGRAQRRLAGVAAAASVFGLLPRMEVTQALAAAVPGFATVAGAPVAGTGAAAGAGLLAKSAALKIAVAVTITAGAVSGAQPVLHALGAKPRGTEQRRETPVTPTASHGGIVTTGNSAEPGNQAGDAGAADDGTSTGEHWSGAGGGDSGSSGDTSSGSDSSGGGDGATSTSSGGSNDAASSPDDATPADSGGGDSSPPASPAEATVVDPPAAPSTDEG